MSPDKRNHEFNPQNDKTQTKRGHEWLQIVHFVLVLSILILDDKFLLNSNLPWHSRRQVSNLSPTLKVNANKHSSDLVQTL